MKTQSTTPAWPGIERTVLLPDGLLATAALYAAPGTPSDAPLLMAGHGGAGHKSDDGIAALAAAVLAQGRCRMLAVDGPVHGARRGDGAPREQVLRDFDRAWRSHSPALAAHASEWHAVLQALPSLGLRPARIGYWGLSMGTALGLPVCSAVPQLSCAVLGMWGLDFEASEHLAGSAGALSVPTLFVARLDDAIFPWPGQKALFDAIAGSDKRMLALPGGHVPPDPSSHSLAVAFVRRHLLAAD